MEPCHVLRQPYTSGSLTVLQTQMYYLAILSLDKVYGSDTKEYMPGACLVQN